VTDQPPTIRVGDVVLARSPGITCRYEARVGGVLLLVYRAYSGDAGAWWGVAMHADNEAGRVRGRSPDEVASRLAERLRGLRAELAALPLGVGT